MVDLLRVYVLMLIVLAALVLFAVVCFDGWYMYRLFVWLLASVCGWRVDCYSLRLGAGFRCGCVNGCCVSWICLVIVWWLGFLVLVC